ncbi:MAG: SpoIIE family protein phosphatase, partial [Desulfofustis sp.]
MARKSYLLNNIAVQAALIIVGLSAASLVLSIYLYQQSMREIALTEVQNKATIFLSAMETSVRRLVMEKNTESLVEMLQERAEYLKDNLNFAVVGVSVRDSDGTVLEHKVRRPDGTLAAPQQGANTDPGHIPEDFQRVVESGQPLVKQMVKTLKMVEGQPELRVIEVYYPVVRRNQGDVMAVIKMVISVESTFELIRDQYQEFSRRVVLGFALAAGLLVVGILFFVRRRIIAPVLAINDGAQRVAAGDLTTRLAPTGSNELSNLMQAFNEMVDGLRHRDRMRRSLAVAKEVQQNLLPHEAPAVAGLDIAGTSIYCDETGGDYFDYICSDKDDGDQVSVVVGDVSGHGISSALLMATTRAFLRQRAALPGSPAEIISDVNTQFSRDVADSGSFMSMFYLSIDTGRQTLDWVRAGHDPAIRYDPDSE